MSDDTTSGVKCVLDFKPIWGLNFPNDFNLDLYEDEELAYLANLDPKKMMNAVYKADVSGVYANPQFHHITHALMLFQKLSQDDAFDGIDPLSLFAACCDTVLIWSFG